MKRVLIFGASGNLGTRIVNRALTEDLEMHIFVRPTSFIEHLPISHLKVTEGDINYFMDVESAFDASYDAVIFTVGASEDEPDTLTTGMQNVLEWMNRSGTEKLLAVGGAGILNQRDDKLVMDQAGFPGFLKGPALKHLEAWKLADRSGIDYTYLCPGRMTAGSFDDPYITSGNYILPEALKGISYEACADMLVQEILDPKYKGKKVSIAPAS